MALVSCPECTHQMSTFAEACPQCGFSPRAIRQAEDQLQALAIDQHRLTRWLRIRSAGRSILGASILAFVATFTLALFYEANGVKLHPIFEVMGGITILISMLVGSGAVILLIILAIRGPAIIKIKPGESVPLPSFPK
jgi:hypothetical protein